MNSKDTHVLRDGHRIPSIGFGVWQVPPEQTEEAVTTAISAGFRSIDTAEAYYNETEVGNALRRSELPRSSFFLTTKVWNTNHGRNTTIKAFAESTRRLGTDVIDLYLLHWPSRVRDLYVETWEALIDLKREGLIKSIGVSNFSVQQLARLIGETGVVPAVNQIELHPRFQQKEVRRFHDRHGIVTESWSPLGMWKNGVPSIQEPVIQRVALKHGKTPAQVVLRWHLQEGLVPLTRSVNRLHVRENIALYDFSLDPDDMEAIRALDSATGRRGPDPDTAEF
ncbi:aldo/keto reductase [Rhizobium mesosinicum]|uniref:Aldo/keto reductase n=1 Tax=Rhizobium mesosinicum TaxID=335017 RepID=A0ABS7GN73_9HYPH|nr:aldo/keto reductase [Rhizobium mesosinicum]MBW9051091.1 aldo/keto reductase [Rhizobium mesosinicum]